jgi:hypothetical protein
MPKSHLKYIIITAFAVLFTWLIHELAHWALGELLGNKMIMTLNELYPVSGEYLKSWHYMATSAAGPYITIVQACFVFWLLIKKINSDLYPFLFACFMCRFGATILSIRNPNDEARISEYFGFGTFTIPLAVTIFLFYLLWKITKTYTFNIKFNAYNFILISLFISSIVLFDKYFQFRLI